LPQTEADAHRPAKEQDDVPGHILQILQRENLEQEEENGRGQDHRALVQRLQGGDEGTQAQYAHRGEDDDQGQLLLARHCPQICVERPGALAQAGDGLLFGFEENHEIEPQEKGHQHADGQHEIGELEEGNLPPDDVLEETDGHRAARRTQQGDDAARAGGKGHADKEALTEACGLVPRTVERMDGDEHRVDRGCHRGVIRVRLAVSTKQPR